MNSTRSEELKRMSRLQFERERERVMRRLAMLRMFSDNSDKAKRARIERCRTDFWAFCRTYLPHYFSTKTQADWHEPYKDTFKVQELFAVFAAPRGDAKSTVGSFADPLHDICYQLEEFIVITMSSMPKAAMQTYRILLELQHNPLIINDFGELASKAAAMDDFITRTTSDRQQAIRVAALGAGMDARGIVFGPHRPSKWICDDIESKKLARNPKRAEELYDTIMTDYFLAMKNKGWKFRVVGTIICRNSVLDKLMQNEELTRFTFKAITNMGAPDQKASWAEHRSLEKLLDYKKKIGVRRFMAEMQNEPLESDGRFKEEWFRHWKEWPDTSLASLVIRIDPSYSSTGDNKAMYAGIRYNHTPAAKSWGAWRDTNGVLFEEGLYRVILKAYNRKASLDQMIADVYEWHKLLKPRYIYIEGTFGQKVILEREFKRWTAKGEKYPPLPIKWVSPKEKKEERIFNLEPILENRLMVFPPRAKNPDMEETIIQFVRYGEPGINDDGPDDLAGLVEILDEPDRKRKTYVGSR